MPQPLPLILDVDTGIDDSLALLYAAASPDADLVAVTCVSGNIDAEQVGINTRAVLELAGRADVEVAMGREIPLLKPLETTPETHGPQGLGHAELPPPSRPLSDRHAVDLILDEARRRPGEITLVTPGPAHEPRLGGAARAATPRLLKGYALMGGAFGVSGNTTPRPNGTSIATPRRRRSSFGRGRTRWQPTRRSSGRWRSASTSPSRRGSSPSTSSASPAAPAAARTTRSPSSAGDDLMAPQRSVASNPIVRYVADALRFYFEFHQRYDGFYGAFIHDPLAVAATLDRTLVATEASSSTSRPAASSRPG